MQRLCTLTFKQASTDSQVDSAFRLYFGTLIGTLIEHIKIDRRVTDDEILEIVDIVADSYPAFTFADAALFTSGIYKSFVNFGHGVRVDFEPHYNNFGGDYILRSLKLYMNAATEFSNIELTNSRKIQDAKEQEEWEYRWQNDIDGVRTRGMKAAAEFNSMWQPQAEAAEREARQGFNRIDYLIYKQKQREQDAN